MAKSSGLGAGLAVGTALLSNDVGSFSVASPHNVFDVTGIDTSARETKTTVRDGMINFAPFFNDAAGRAHPVLSALPTTDVLTTAFIGSSIGGAAASLQGKQLNYDGTRPADGSITFATATAGNGFGLEWGRMATAGVVTSTGAEDLASYDWGAASSFGLQAYLHVFAFTGTSVTITIEESSDDGVGDSFAAVTGGAFTAVTGATTERIATSGSQTVEQYLQLALTGTYSSVQFLVVINRNTVSTSF